MIMKYFYKLDKGEVDVSFRWPVPQNVVELPNREACQEPSSTGLGVCRATAVALCLKTITLLLGAVRSVYIRVDFSNVCYATLD